MKFNNVEVISQIPSFVFWKDLNSVFLGCNFNFAKSAGLNSPKEIEGKTDYDLPWAETHASLYQDGDNEVLNGVSKVNHIETQLQSNGNIVTLILNKLPLLDHQGQKIGIIGSYHVLEEDNKIDAQINKLTIQNKKEFYINRLLSKRELDCLRYTLRGKTAKQIAQILSLSCRTVEHYLETIKEKMNVKSKSELIEKTLDFYI